MKQPIDLDGSLRASISDSLLATLSNRGYSETECEMTLAQLCTQDKSLFLHVLLQAVDEDRVLSDTEKSTLKNNINNALVAHAIPKNACANIFWLGAPKV